MLGFTGKHCRRTDAYSLAEVLIVMSIIMLIILALPPVTKKVFKVKDTMKAHGRFECYWKGTADGTHLFSYVHDENGYKSEVDLTDKYGAERDYCEFTPGANTVYFMVHAVGGGGAGATIAKKYNNTELKPKDLDIQSNYDIMTSNVAVYPKWLTWLKNTKFSSVPWYSGSGAWKSSFQVSSLADHQQIRYSLGGSAGNIASTFVPALPGNAKLRMYPGRGGVLARTDDSGAGTAGGDTYIEFVYSTGSPIEMLRARGGLAGKGDLDVSVDEVLVGGKATDFGLTTKASVKSRVSNFGDVIENVEDLGGNKESKVPENAGNSGNGETQFVVDTAGNLYYEYGQSSKDIEGYMRVEQEWQPITALVGTKYYENNYSDSNCTQRNKTITLTRSGYCDYDEDYEGEGEKGVCVIGYAPENCLTQMTLPRCTYAYSPAGKERMSYTLTVSADNTYSLTPYTPYSFYNKFTGCVFDPTYWTLKCKIDVANVPYHQCTNPSPSDSNVKCSNGDTPMCTSSSPGTIYSAYSNCMSGANQKYAKCPANKGEDGAVVVLW